ncbi:hypothetical protein JR316_0000246 [Psilocybe cubensis]|uniref:Uncharacterized protein n=1 Tax=Psilocybe cubensis TaxID=181762 RepID=A0ACB8HEP8_PSICU|nr:hypothetical protein JR316_0000246 [Psilocybe cubensis]KAH9486182.1 hypothetical protein JR316_0000246 [Psilocybe cubensis]
MTSTNQAQDKFYFNIPFDNPQDLNIPYVLKEFRTFSRMMRAEKIESPTRRLWNNFTGMRVTMKLNAYNNQDFEFAYGDVQPAITMYVFEHISGRERYRVRKQLAIQMFNIFAECMNTLGIELDDTSTGESGSGSGSA